LNILYISPSYYPAFKYGGPTQAIFLLTKALVKKNTNVDVFTTNAGIEKKNIRTNTWYDYEGVRVKYFRYIGYEHYNFSVTYLNELRKTVKNYDLVHITALWNFPVLVASFLSSKYNLPYLITLNGVLTKEAFNIKSTRIKKIYFNLFSKKNIFHSSALHFTSKYEEEKFLEFTNITKKSSFIIPNGLDLSAITFNEEIFFEQFPLLKDKKYILFLGRLNKIKGIDVLISAFKKLSQEFTDLFLVICGPDNDNYRLEIDNFLDHTVINKIMFTGSITEKDKWTALKSAELFVLPSYSENFGLAAIEAMACGTPVIVSNKVGIYKEVQEAEAGLVVETTPESIYTGIKKILASNELKKKLSENGKKLVFEKYDINKVADQMIEEYKRIIEVKTNN
jgi:glycosyltransferase involved in cell wall biosynthesis